MANESAKPKQEQTAKVEETVAQLENTKAHPANLPDELWRA